MKKFNVILDFDSYTVEIMAKDERDAEIMAKAIYTADKGHMFNLVNTEVDEVEEPIVLGDIVITKTKEFSFYGFKVEFIDEHGQYEDIEGIKHIAARCKRATEEELKMMGFENV